MPGSLKPPRSRSIVTGPPPVVRRMLSSSSRRRASSSGFSGARIGDGGYLAMGSTVTNDITVGAGTFLGIGSLLLRDTDPHAMYHGHPAKKVTPASSTSAPGSRA